MTKDEFEYYSTLVDSYKDQSENISRLTSLGNLLRNHDIEMDVRICGTGTGTVAMKLTPTDMHEGLEDRILAWIGERIAELEEQREELGLNILDTIIADNKIE